MSDPIDMQPKPPPILDPLNQMARIIVLETERDMLREWLNSLTVYAMHRDPDGVYACPICGAWDKFLLNLVFETERHKPDCTWRLAHEYLAGLEAES